MKSRSGGAGALCIFMYVASSCPWLCWQQQPQLRQSALHSSTLAQFPAFPAGPTSLSMAPRTSKPVKQTPTLHGLAGRRTARAFSESRRVLQHFVSCRSVADEFNPTASADPMSNLEYWRFWLRGVKGAPGTFFDGGSFSTKELCSWDSLDELGADVRPGIRAGKLKVVDVIRRIEQTILELEAQCKCLQVVPTEPAAKREYVQRISQMLKEDSLTMMAPELRNFNQDVAGRNGIRARAVTKFHIERYIEEVLRELRG
ncbi:unnamed protein product [Polarella glacialis]|uniref:Uncharacterized protein n=1 Tax=Polarella glacialis TaxID=89957 RepID=A0A813GXF8_POLGL|nr:unnamed protein product [Polarella glacialis]CAE8722223.1 unnamed protein product [Polarella glacialis]